MRLFVLSIALVVSVIGCAYIDQSLKIDPKVTLTKSDIGKGKEIGVQIIDDREE